VAFGDIGSTSNMLCPMQLMADYGVDPVNEVEKVHTSRNIAHEALKAGDIDAIGTNATSWMEGPRAKDESVPYGFFKMIARSGDLPNDMIMVGSHVPAEAAQSLRAAVLENKEAIIDAILTHEENENIAAWTSSPSRTTPMMWSARCTATPAIRSSTTSSATEPVARDMAAPNAGAAEADLSVKGLVKTFGQGGPVLNGLEFEVARGASVALVGANGTGKSTLLRLCLGLIAPDAGSVRLLGEDVAKLARGRFTAGRLRRLRARTGLVAQRHNLVPRLSALSNVIHGLLGRGSGPRYWTHALAPAEARAEAMAALDRVGLADLALRRADSLSGGQSQRVAIARALVARPRLIVADEPTASLDPAAGEDVMALFFRLVRSEGVTVIFTSHNVAHALSYGDRVLGLAGGRLAVNAPAADLTERDIGALYG
jgi:phosphonate transport system ATP-binding protein